MEKAHASPGNQAIKRSAIHRHFENVCDKGCQDDNDKLCSFRNSQRWQPSVHQPQNLIVQDGRGDYE